MGVHSGTGSRDDTYWKSRGDAAAVAASATECQDSSSKAPIDLDDEVTKLLIRVYTVNIRYTTLSAGLEALNPPCVHLRPPLRLSEPRNRSASRPFRSATFRT